MSRGSKLLKESSIYHGKTIFTEQNCVYWDIWIASVRGTVFESEEYSKRYNIIIFHSDFHKYRVKSYQI